MNIRRLVLDVDKAVSRPDLVAIAEAIDGVEALNVTVTLERLALERLGRLMESL